MSDVRSLSNANESLSSNNEKPGFKPRSFTCALIMVKPMVWKVDTFSPRASGLPKVCATRSFISRAALLVKVTAAM